MMPASSWLASMIAADQPRNADAVGAHVDELLGAVRPRDLGAHRLGILGAEIEDVADLDAARRDAPILGNLLERNRIVLLVGRGVLRRPRD